MVHDVMIVGGGPVGLLLANLLGMRNIKTLVVERNTGPEQHSKAIGITPPSLHILQRAGLIEKFLREGVPIDTIAFYSSGDTRVATLSLKKTPPPYNFVLGLPQQKTTAYLAAGLRRFEQVTLRDGAEFLRYQERGDAIAVTLRNLRTGAEEIVHARYVVACDGCKSSVRDAAGVTQSGRPDHDTFFMGDYVDHSGYGDEAHLFFTRDGAVETFPITDGKRRWVVQTDRYIDDQPERLIEDLVRQRTGIVLDAALRTWQGPFGIQHKVNRHYFKGRVSFCGDAAHVISPIGGQGMNTGFADADFLAHIFQNSAAIQKGIDAALFQHYERCRKRAVRSALWRAWFGMQLGTVRGPLLSTLRNRLFQIALNSKLFGERILPPTFTMLNIPYGSFDKVKALRHLSS